MKIDFPIHAVWYPRRTNDISSFSFFEGNIFKIFPLIKERFLIFVLK